MGSVIKICCSPSAEEEFNKIDQCVYEIGSTTFLDTTNVPKMELSFFQTKIKTKLWRLQYQANMFLDLCFLKNGRKRDRKKLSP